MQPWKGQVLNVYKMAASIYHLELLSVGVLVVGHGLSSLEQKTFRYRLKVYFILIYTSPILYTHLTYTDTHAPCAKKQSYYTDMHSLLKVFTKTHLSYTYTHSPYTYMHTSNTETHYPILLRTY